MTALRSILFNLYFIGGLALFSVVMSVLLPLPRTLTQGAFRLWVRSALWVLEMVAGLSYEIRGIEHLPAGPAVIASKHQSAWDTGIFFLLTRNPAYVLKKELLSIPFYGWSLARSGMIAIDRAGGVGALKGMIREARAALETGRKVIVFPEGTRTAPGERHSFHPGIAALYTATEVPVIPVAVNSGLFWGRRNFLKHPGVITLEFLPAMPRGLDRRAFMDQLMGRLNTTSERLEDEARSRFPHLPEAR